MIASGNGCSCHSQVYQTVQERLDRCYSHSVSMLLNRNSTGNSPRMLTRVEELAKKKGCNMAQVATAWILSKPHVTAPIVGTTSIDNLNDILNE